MARHVITFDFDTTLLEQTYHNGSLRNAYIDIRKILEDHGFENRQGSVYSSAEESIPVEYVVDVRAIVNENPWFAASLKDLRMLRVEDGNDLMPAIRPTNCRKRG